MIKFAISGLLVLGLIGAPPHAVACSNFLFDKAGQILVAHNMDWVSGEGMVVINKRNVKKRGFQVKDGPEFSWTSKYGSMTLSLDGREITGRGMNEVGLVILEAAMQETQQAGGLPLLSVGQWVQYQLDTSASIDEVIASDKVVRIWPDDMQSHFLLRDKSGRVAVIEWLGGEMAVYEGSKLPIPATVNSPYAACVSDGDDRTGRFKIIADKLAGYDASRDGDALEYTYSILRDVSNKLSFPSLTQWSVVFDLRAQRLYLSTAQNSDLRFVDFKSFDLSCETDVQVLDINGPGSGDIRSAFLPYTTSFNDTLVRRVYDIYSQYGVITPEDTLKEIIEFPDTTICVASGQGGSGGGSGGSVSTGGQRGTLAGETGGTGLQGQGGGVSGSSRAGSTGTWTTSITPDGSGGSSGTSAALTSNGDGSGCSCRFTGSDRTSKGLVLLLVGWVMARSRSKQRRES